MNKLMLMALTQAGALVCSALQAQAGLTNLVLQGTWPQGSNGSAVAVVVAGHYAYVANGIRGLAVIDVSDPAHPAWTGGFQTAGYAEAICVLDHYVYLSAPPAGMYVLDVADPTNPVQVGNTDGTMFFRTAQAAGDLLFLGAGNLRVLDVSDPASPELVADVSDMGAVFYLQIVGNYLVFGGEIWWSIYEVSDPVHPARVSTCDMAPFVNSVAVASNHTYVAEGTTLHVFDTHDLAQPARVGGQTLNDTIADLEAVGDHLFVAHGTVSVFELSDPGHPARVAGFETSAAQDIEVVGNYVFVANGNGGLVLLESQPLVLPALTILPETTNASIRWPASALGYRLESRADLHGANWTALPETPQYRGGVFSVSVPMLTNQFFRLRRY